MADDPGTTPDMARDMTRDFVRHAPVAARMPPPGTRGPLAWLEAHVFASPWQLVASLAAFGLMVVVLEPTIRFLIVDAVWTGDRRQACLPGAGESVGACWPFIQAKFSQLIYGFYPADERWRVNLVFALGALLLAPLLIPRVPLKTVNAALFFGALPVAAFFLLYGGGLDGVGIAALAGLIKNVSDALASLARLIAMSGTDTAIAGVTNSIALGIAVSADIVRMAARPLDTLLRLFRESGHPLWLDMATTAAFVCVIGLATFGRRTLVPILAAFAVLAAIALALRLDRGGLPVVETRLWGGLLVTLVVSVTGITASIPVGIELALGRRSRMPLVRLVSIAFIEFWRGVPLVTVLFFATYMLPLFLPGGMSFDGLMRVLIGIALFAGAYNAEVIRGGLQAISRGQQEAGVALGLGRGRVTALIVLPQALRHVIPSLVNSFIALFKDTTLVLIVAIFDFLGQMRAAFADPNWLTPSTLFTGFAFAGMVYFVFCFSMSRYSLALEARLNPHRRHRGLV